MRIGALLQGAVLLTAGCGSTAMPGTALGTFSIDATSTANSCGDGLGTQSPWDFDVELSRDVTRLYWRKDEVTMSGVLSSDLKATITGTTTTKVVAADAGIAGCTMSRDDSVTVSLGTATVITAVSGTMTLIFDASTESDCSAELAANGGTYDELPCELDYSFTGTRTKAP